MTRRELTLKERNRRRLLIIILVFFLLLTVFFIGCLVGPYPLGLKEVLKTLFGSGDKNSNLVIFNFRLPRLFLALLVGLGMGASGVIMQNLLHNDLASPGTLGVADGSSLFVTLYFALISKKNDAPYLLPFLALIGGILSAIIIYFLGTKRKKPISSTKLVMTGVAMAALYSAISTFMMYVLDENQLESLQRWNAGDISSAVPWANVIILGVWIIIFFGLTLINSNDLDVINLGYDTATSLGLNVKKSFFINSFLAVGMASVSVAFGGNFFFLGLIGPHIARKLVGTKTKYLITLSGVISATIIIVANVLVENVPIFMNIPTGIFVSIISVPYFIYLLIKAR